MHDVLVLALTIFFIKAQGIYDAASLNGVYFFTAAVVLMILSYAWLRTEGLATAALMHEPGRRARAGARPLSPFRNFVLCFLIIVATVFFALGIILPVIRFTTVYVWTNEHSIATIIWALFENEEYFLTVVLFLFSILFPFLKLLYLLTLVTSPDIPPEFRKKSISTMEWLGRYSMTDVMVLALMIFYVNSSGYTEASVLPGVYFFAASALITMLAYGWANTVPARWRVNSAPKASSSRCRPIRRGGIGRPTDATAYLIKRAGGEPALRHWMMSRNALSVSRTHLLARVELDHEVRFHRHRIRHVRQRRDARQLRGHLAVVGVDVVRHVALGALDGLEHERQLARLLLDLDHVADAAAEARDGHAAAVDRHVAVARRTGGRRTRSARTWRGRRRRRDGARAGRSGARRSSP